MIHETGHERKGVKMYAILTKGNNLCDFQYASLDNMVQGSKSGPVPERKDLLKQEPNLCSK